jgi:hypothetical protein
MTLYSLALRIKEIIDLQTEYERTRDREVLLQSRERRDDLNVLVDSIVNAYQATAVHELEGELVDVDQFGC